MARSGAACVTLACIISAAAPARADRVACRDGADGTRVAAALGRIRGGVDPCGESAEVAAVLRRVERCAYEVCTSVTADRNLFDRAVVTWNPDLTSEVESTRDDTGGTAVLRDPTASLLHELVHAADDCEGRNPGEHELEAVRIENIYRRAAGLAQRTGYGELRLPPSMIRECRPGRCTCPRPGAIDVR